jgi:hypothetical protein
MSSHITSVSSDARVCNPIGYMNTLEAWSNTSQCLEKYKGYTQFPVIFTRGQSKGCSFNEFNCGFDSWQLLRLSPHPRSQMEPNRSRRFCSHWSPYNHYNDWYVIPTPYQGAQFRVPLLFSRGLGLSSLPLVVLRSLIFYLLVKQLALA